MITDQCVVPFEYKSELNYVYWMQYYMCISKYSLVYCVVSILLMFIAIIMYIRIAKILTKSMNLAYFYIWINTLLQQI